MSETPRIPPVPAGPGAERPKGGPREAGKGGQRFWRRFRVDPRRDAVKILLVLGALLLVDAVFHFAVLRPQSLAVARLEEEKATFDESFRRSRKRAEQVKEAYQTAVKRQEEIEYFYGTMMSTKQERLALAQDEILRIGKSFNTIPDPLNLDPKELEDQGVEMLTISFPLEGGYENLRRFVNALETSENLLIIDQINLTENRAGGRGLRLAIDVTTYFDAPHLKSLKSQAGRSRSRGPRRR
jgi:Tfp pilus assembly protein PilO